MGSFNVERDFVSFLESLGIPPAVDGDIIGDGRKRRYRILGDKPRERNGEYCLYSDEHPAGWCKSYSAKHGVEYEKWFAGKEAPDNFSEEYFAERARKVEARQEEDRRKKEFTAKTAERAMAAATPVRQGHPYLVKKGISGPLPDGIGQIGQDIVVPLLDTSGQMWNRQAISPSGEKRFLPGRKMGCFYEIPGDGEAVFLAEGLATGLTVHEATGNTVIVAFDCGNLRPVAESLASKYGGRLVTAADNDHRTNGNPGVAAASALSEEMEIPFVVPPFAEAETGTDWNDYAALHGIERTAEEIGTQLDAWHKDLERRGSFVPWADFDKKGNPLKTTGNVRILLRHLGCRVYYDQVKKSPRYEIPGVTFAPDNRDNSFLSYLLSECYRNGFPLGRQLLDLYLFEIQDAARRNPVREWISSKPWDGVSRFDDLFSSLKISPDYDPKFARLVLKRWLISCVVAAFAGDDENLQFRGVLVLQGPQAIGKSLWLRNLCPETSDWFLGGLTLDTQDKDSVIKAISHWIVELGELDATFKAQDISRLKQFVTQGDDTLRLPYAPKPATYKRRTVYCASVNPGAFQNDSTGNTRWWTIPVLSCNFQHGLDMQQIWAEVRTWQLEGERYWMDKAETDQLEEANMVYQKADPVEDLISRLYTWDTYDADVQAGRTEWLTATEVLQKCKGMDHPTRQQTDVAAQVLRRLTGRNPVRRGHAGARCYLVPRDISEDASLFGGWKR